MKLYLVRHGEPSYSNCTQRGLKGQGRDLAALNEEGIQQILDITLPRIANHSAQIILSSPYTRSLQTAAIIASKTGLITKVVHDLHEWIPDMTFNYATYKELKSLYHDFYKHRGILPDNPDVLSSILWEDLLTFRARVNNALATYECAYESAIVVAHGMVIQSLTGQHIGYSEVIEMNYSPDMLFPEWVFSAPKDVPMAE